MSIHLGESIILIPRCVVSRCVLDVSALTTLIHVLMCVYVFTGFLPCGAVEFLADYRGDAPFCFSAEASPLAALAPTVPPTPSSPQVQDATCHAELCL